MEPHIHVLKMGGTIEFIDPAYDEINKKLLKLDSTIESYLSNLIKPHFTYSSETITQKDSREITNSDREALVRAINATDYTNIVVAHGTFTMRKTADFLAQNVSASKKIVLTGSMIPLTGFAASDAGFNLGFAIASFPYIEAGVFIAMNGKLFSSHDAKKNIDNFRFE